MTFPSGNLVRSRLTNSLLPSAPFAVGEWAGQMPVLPGQEGAEEVFGVVGLVGGVADFEVEMRGDGHPVAGVGVARGLPHVAEQLASGDW